MGDHQAFAGLESCNGMLDGIYVVGVDVGAVEPEYGSEMICIEYVASFYAIFKPYDCIGIGNHCTFQTYGTHHIPPTIFV